VGSHDDLLVWELAKKISREQVGRKLGLTHTGCNIDNDALLLARNNVFKDFGQFPVVRSDLETGVHVQGKAQHGILSNLFRRTGGAFFQVL